MRISILTQVLVFVEKININHTPQQPDLKQATVLGPFPTPFIAYCIIYSLAIS